MSQNTSKTCECPHCGKLVKVEALIEFRITEGEEGNIDWRHGLTEDELYIIKIAEESGLLNQFSSVVQIIKASRSEIPPKSMERYLLSFLRTSVPRQLPRYALDMLFKELDRRNERGKKVDFFCGQGLGMVAIDGKISFFIPEELLLGKKVKGTKGMRTSAQEEEVEDWFRSRTGFLEKNTGNYNKWRAKTLKSHALKKQSNGNI